MCRVEPPDIVKCPDLVKRWKLEYYNAEKGTLGWSPGGLARYMRKQRKQAAQKDQEDVIEWAECKAYREDAYKFERKLRASKSDLDESQHEMFDNVVASLGPDFVADSPDNFTVTDENGNAVLKPIWALNLSECAQIRARNKANVSGHTATGKIIDRVFYELSIKQNDEENAEFRAQLAELLHDANANNPGPHEVPPSPR